jgi:hypothetical protein
LIIIGENNETTAFFVMPGMNEGEDREGDGGNGIVGK